jgi:DIM1 family U5 snRNP protein
MSKRDGFILTILTILFVLLPYQIYVVDIDEVPDFNNMYELFDPCTTMFFYRNKHIMVDLGTGDNNKINWALSDKQEMIDIIEVVYRGARKGRGLVVAPKDYSTKYRY